MPIRPILEPMRALSRRRLLRAVVLPLGSGVGALAVVPVAARESPQRMKPLGVWKVVTPKIQGRGGETIPADLLFRPAIDVEEPTLRYWIPRLDVVAQRTIVRCPTLPGAPPSPPNGVILPPMIAGVQTLITLDIAFPLLPRRPLNVGKGEQRSDRLALRQPNPRVRAYQVMVELADPASCRRSIFGFKILFEDEYPQ